MEEHVILAAQVNITFLPDSAHIPINITTVGDFEFELNSALQQCRLAERSFRSPVSFDNSVPSGHTL